MDTSELLGKEKNEELQREGGNGCHAVIGDCCAAENQDGTTNTQKVTWTKKENFFGFFFLAQC